jgi:CheY-like chemotaxis protein
VVAVEDGAQCLEELRKEDNDFDLILLDLFMPDTPMDGFEALNIIMNDDKLKNIPLVVMSASESNDIISDCLKRGATNFLVKPIRLQ